MDEESSIGAGRYARKADGGAIELWGFRRFGSAPPAFTIRLKHGERNRADGPTGTIGLRKMRAATADLCPPASRENGRHYREEDSA